MLDKNELEDLLVKLRLGTISIESAITEIEQNFYSVDENENISIWQKLECPFDEVLECDNLSIAQIENYTAKMTKTNTKFILTGLTDEAVSEISAKYAKCKPVFESGIIKCIDKENKLNTEKKVVIVSSLNKDEKIVAQIEVILNIMGIAVEFYNVSPYKTVSMQVLKTYLHSAKAVIVVYDKDIRLPSIVSNITAKPVVVLSKHNNAEEYMLSNGAVLAKSGSSISACMAVARLLK